MICLECAQLRAPATTRCPACQSELLAVTEPSLKLLVDELLRRRLEQWSRDGVVDRFTAARIGERLPPAPAPAPAPAAPPQPAVTVLPPPEAERARREALGLQELDRQAAIERAHEQRERRQRKHEEKDRKAAAAKVRAEKERAAAQARQAPPHAPATPAGADAFGALKDRAASVAGVEAFVALDEQDPASGGGALGSLLAEYVWWFIGAVLVVGGSLMGVREAWLALGGGSGRQLLVAAALFGYHTGFVGLAAVVARKSLRSGRVLSAVALALLPVVFVALAALTRLAPLTGMLATAVGIGLCAWTMSVTARRFDDLETGDLAGALVPTLCAQVSLAALPAESWGRALAPLVGVGSIAFVIRRRFWGEVVEPPAGTVLLAALYGALALVALAVLGTPDGGVGPQGLALLSPGTVRFTGLAFFAVLTLGALAAAAALPGSRSRWPRSAPIAELLCLAAVAAAAIGTAAPLWGGSAGTERFVDAASLLLAVVIVGIFVRATERREGWLHVAVPAAALAGALAANLALPGEPQWWPAGACLVVPALLALSDEAVPARRLALQGWAVGLSLVCVPLAITLGPPVLDALDSPWSAALAATALVAVSAHFSAFRHTPQLHFLAAGAATTFAVCWFAPGPASLFASRAALGLAAAGGAYRLAGWLLSPAEQRRGPSSDATTRLCPFDDVASALALLAGATAVLAARPIGVFLSDPGWSWYFALRLAGPSALAAALLALACLRERSAVFAVPAVGVAVLVVDAFTGASTNATSALVHAALAVALTLAGWLLRPAQPATGVTTGRVLGVFDLPWPGSLRALFADAAAWVALALTGWVALSLVGWLGTRVEPERNLAILAGAAAVVVWLLAFALPLTSARPRLRGAVATLSIGAGLIALTAIVNRLGRPLPPEVVARNLSAGIFALWLVSRAAARWGPALARRLENEPAGRWYHAVPLAGVGALGLLLLVDALVMSAPFTLNGLVTSPPLFLFGAALASALLSHTLKVPRLRDLSVALALGFAATVGAQRAVLGPALAQVLGPAGPWVPVGNEAACAQAGWSGPTCFFRPDQTVVSVLTGIQEGLAVALVALAALSLLRPANATTPIPEAEPGTPLRAALARVGRNWTLAGAGLVVTLAWWVPHLPSACLVLLAGGLLVFSRAGRTMHVLFLSLWLLLSAFAASLGLVPAWAGPALAALALLDAATPLLLEGVSGGRRIERVSAVLPLAVCWSLATGTLLQLPGAGWQILAGALLGFGNQGWAASPPLAQTLALASLALGLYAVPTGARLARGAAIAATLVGGLTAAAWLADLPDLAAFAPKVALALAGLAAAAHVANRLLGRRPDAAAAAGFRAGRDGMLLAVGGWIVGLAAVAVPRTPDAVLFGLGALVVAVGPSLHAVWRERSSRHVYFVECAVIGGYALLRSQSLVPVRPETDAVFALVLGFVLVGVNVMARRAGLTPVSEAARRSAIILPLVVAVLLGGNPTHSGALAAAGSGLLYGALAAVERSRRLGSLAAVAANVALLVWALASGLDGIEIWLAPLGLLLIMLGHLFGATLDPSSRGLLRLLGGLLLYAPAGIKLTLQLSGAPDGSYAVVFGALCLLGVVAGMVLRVRAYLGLGAFFITLDVVVNLLQASLRDHRMAFLILSAAGLAIIGAMVLVTLRRELIHQKVSALRGLLKRWD